MKINLRVHWADGIGSRMICVPPLRFVNMWLPIPTQVAKMHGLTYEYRNGKLIEIRPVKDGGSNVS